jgi:uncharacterized protein YwgA
MEDYWLAKLISSVAEVDSRKRLQKSIYLLQCAGCPLQVSYILHYYGPYSFELAGLIDQLHGAGIINETAEMLSNSVVRYKSKIADKGKQVLENFEKTEDGKRACAKITPFVPLFKDLNEKDPRVLELAATIAYFYEGDWAEAQKQTAIFKKLSENDSGLKQAFELAKGFRKSA